MKRNITICAVSSLLLFGCSSKVEPSASNVFGDSALIEQIVSQDGDLSQAFVYNDEMQLVEIAFNDPSSTLPTLCIDYGKGETYGNKYDVKISNLDPETSLLHYLDGYFKLNKKGFIEKGWLEVEAGCPEPQYELECEYSDDNELTKYVLSGLGMTITEQLQWKEGDIVTCERRVEIDGSVNVDKIVLHYITGDISNPIDNVAGINPYASAFGMNMGFGIGNAYFAGLLGVSTRHLPLMYMSGQINDPERHNVDWLLNAQNYPVRLKVSTAYEDGQIWSFDWYGQVPYVDPQHIAAQEGISQMYSEVLAGISNVARYDQTSRMTPELKELWDAAMQESGRRNEPWIDCSPWMQSSEWANLSIVSVDLIAGDTISAKARVTISLSDADAQTRALTIKAKNLNGQWMVDDFVQEDGTSLKNMAQSYLSIRK